MGLIREVKRNNIGRVRELLDQGANPNFRDSFGTVLFEASHNGLTEMVRLLLDRGADPNIQDRFGFTALSDAVNHSRNKTVELLLDRGADPNIKSGYGITALMLASRNGNNEIVKLLLDHGADPNIRDRDGKTASMIEEERGERGHNDVARLIRDHIRLQRARQRLAFATFLLGDNTHMDDLDYDVTARIAEYVNDLDQYGSGSKQSSRSSSRSEQSRRSRRKRIKNKYYTRRTSFF